MSSVVADLVGIPTVPFKAARGKGAALHDIKSIIVDHHHASLKDETGSTLIPPTLLEFANTFAEDLSTTFGLHVPVKQGGGHQKDSIYLTVGEPSEYCDDAGEETSEGYTLSSSQNGIVISGASPLGVWWGTRTVLQQAVLNHGLVPAGSGVDRPGWKTRGMMLDCGRHFYPKDFLIELCSYMSYFKQNTFHLHLSDNLSINSDYTYEEIMHLYARFRLWSDSPSLAGLAKYKNESYTREDFDEIQTKCAARGVTILPEIEAPGHALPIVQWRPQIGYSSDLSLLNITHPEAIPTMKEIWSNFLPWFHTKVVSIGADEYTGPATDYNHFVNVMDGFIGESGKNIRIWGTFPPVYNSTYVNIYQNVSVQHWEFFDDDPYWQYIKNNYSVVNSNDDFYIVNKWGGDGGYLPDINLTKTFHGSPTGGLWYPNMFSQTNATEDPPKSNPYLLGAIEALWNDYGYNATVFSEAYYAWRSGLPALADKHWGGKLLSSEFAKVFPALHPYIPAQNLDRAIPSKGDMIFDYKLDRVEGHGMVKDNSKNGYDARTNCGHTKSGISVTPHCSLTTPWSSKGRNYTLSMSLKVDKLQDPTKTTLIAGSDSTLMLTPNITLFASGNYYRLNSTIPMHEWVDLSVMGRGNQTFATVTSANGKKLSEEQFLTQMGINGDYFHWDVMGIEAPIKEVTGWTGELSALSLTSTA